MKICVTHKEYIQTLFSLSIPIILENILQTLLGTIDTYFAGRINDIAIAAIGINNLIVNIFIAFYTAITVGTTVIISRNVGKQNLDIASLAIKQSIILGIVISLTIGLFSFIFYKPILVISGTTSEMLVYAIPYYLIVTVPSIFLCLSIILSGCLRAIKDSKIPMIATCIANIVNIIFNFIFIKFGLGIIGLALATTISRIIGVCILLIKLNNKKHIVKVNLKKWCIDKELIISICNIGIPAGIEKLIMRFGQLLYNNIIIYIGASSYIAHNIAGNIESYSYIPAMGFGIATSTLIGISLGENNIKKSKKVVYISYIVTATIMIFIGIIFYVFAPLFASLFTSNISIQNMVIRVLRLIAFFQPFVALTQIMSSALQGAGDTKFPMYTTLIGIWGIRIVIGYILAIVFKLGIIGVWYAYAFDIVIRGCLLSMRFLYGRWQRIRGYTYTIKGNLGKTIKVAAS